MTAPGTDNVHSIQGEAHQGELVPNRRAKFVGMSVNELEEPLPYGGTVKLEVTGTVVGDGRERRKDGVEVFTSKVQVGDVRITSVEQPAEGDPQLPIDDDVAEG